MIKNETKKQRKDRKAREAKTEEIRVARAKKRGEVLVVGKQEDIAKLAAQAKVDKAVAEVVEAIPIKKVTIPWCKAPGCGGSAATTRGLCRKHEEMFLYIYWLFTAKKLSGLVIPGEQQGKPMTNFDLLIKGKL